MINLDQWTLDILTNPIVLDIDAYSSYNLEASVQEPFFYLRCHVACTSLMTLLVPDQLFKSTAGKSMLQMVDCEDAFVNKTTWSIRRRVKSDGDQVLEYSHI